MCNCVKYIEKQVNENLSSLGKYKKPIKCVSMTGIGYPIYDGNVCTRTANYIEVELEGKKKNEQLTMFHSFCPFCGVKYEQP